MREEIKEAVDAYKAAGERLQAVLDVEQAKCKHERVIHSPWRSSDWGSAFRARRLCLDCGLEEEGTYGWSDGEFKSLKTEGFHKEVSSDELYRSRLPRAAVP